MQLILTESNTLFRSLTGKIVNYPDLRDALRKLLMTGEEVAWNANQYELDRLYMYGFIRTEKGKVKIANRIFETILYNLFLSDDELKGSTFSREGSLAANIFVQDGHLNVRLILEKFIATYHEICGPLKEKFLEKDGREAFLLYLKPIINGTGNYYIEAATRDGRRLDVVIDYLGERFIIELKIWRGDRYNAAGEQQIAAYLDYFGLSTGYMLSFNFNQNKECGVKKVALGDKVLWEGTV